MPAKARPKHRAKHRATSVARSHHRAAHNRHHKRRHNEPRVVVISPRHNKHRGHRAHRKNPHFFGQQATPAKMAEYIAGGLIGVTVNRAVLPMLPAAVTGNNLFAVIAAVGIAFAEWWAGSFVSKDFGSAVGFGALMNAGSQALNTFLPSIGSMTSAPGLSGRGFGDLVPSQPGLPFWPSSAFPGAAAAHSPYMGGTSAYPRAYGTAA